ncbi:MAG: hypothetical protein JWO42_2271, partial [Chloroflexi bacterium]|nr:hypothetical protein [Chloroflexota bacterium]
MPIDALRQVENLTVSYPTQQERFQAVKSLNLRLMPGEIFGLVGESG